MKIALMGYARSGKDTVYELLRQKSMFHRLAFSDQLRFHIHKLVPTLPTDPKPRKAYEIFGKALREIREDFWVEQLESVYDNMSIDFDMDKVNICITDCRQPNEAFWCRKNGFKIVYVQSDPGLRKERSVNDTNWVEVNKSEKWISTIESDYMLTNNGSLEDLKSQINTMIDYFKLMEGYDEN